MLKVKKLQSILLFVALSVFLCLSTIIVQAQGLPEHWESQDIGDVGAAGSATFENDVFTVIGSGADIWFQEDAFHFAYQPAKGDCEITAYVASVEETAGDAKACIMIRETLDSNSAFAMAVTCPSSNFGTYFQRRPYPSAECDNTNLKFGLPAPVWLRLVREGDDFTASYSEDGNTWNTVAPANILMNEDVYIGLGVCAHNDGLLCHASFENVEVDPGPVDYTSVNDLTPLNPESYQLNQNYPNPFNPSTKIDYYLPKSSFVSIKIYDMMGREIKNLIEGEQLRGMHSVTWNGTNKENKKAASSIYFYKLETNDFKSIRKMVLLK